MNNTHQNAAIELEQIHFAYGEDILFENLFLSFQKGKIHGLLGPNGAGKSTLIKIMAGLVRPTKGRIKLHGHLIHDDHSLFGKMIGLLSDQAPLYPTMSVESYLIFCAKIKKVKNINESIKALMTKLDLQHVKNKVIQTLSTGYRQRVALAQALVHQPEILILDEPTSGLDPQSAGNLRTILKEISTHHTIIFSSHLLNDVEQLCSDVTFVNEGKIIYHGDLNQMLGLGKRSNQTIYTLKINTHKKINADLILKNNKVNITAINESQTNQVELIFTTNSDQDKNDFLKELILEGYFIDELLVRKNDLENTFINLVKKPEYLRDQL